MSTKVPNWDDLYEIASAQDGHFTSKQSAEAGYYPQLLNKDMRNGKLTPFDVESIASSTFLPTITKT